MPDQNDLLELFGFEEIDDVGDVHGEIDRRVCEMHTLAEAGERRRVDLVSRRP